MNKLVADPHRYTSSDTPAGTSLERVQTTVATIRAAYAKLAARVNPASGRPFYRDGMSRLGETADVVVQVAVAGQVILLMRPDHEHREPTAELRGEALAWQQGRHLLHVQMANLADKTRDRLGRAALDLTTEYINGAEKLLQALDDVLDPRQCECGHPASVRHLTDRVERANRALRPPEP
jgi:hypothetical protein